MQKNDSETLNNGSISAAKLEKHFDEGIKDFEALLDEIDISEKDELIDLLETITEKIAAARE